MRPIHWVMIALALSVPLPVAAQSDAPGDTSQLAPPQPQKKGGGLFGKAKGLAKNKVVKAVAKTAACTMLPGGQVIAGAIDAAESRNAGEAATSAAGAAMGKTCTPGGLGGAVMPGAGPPGLAGAAAQGGELGLPGAALTTPPPGMPQAGGAMPGMAGLEKFGECLGLTPKEFQEFSAPTGGQMRPMTEQESKRQLELSKKIDPRRAQACAMQSMVIPGQATGE